VSQDCASAFLAHQANAVALISGVGSGLVLVGVTFATAVRTLTHLRAQAA
jgi:hypothetical protein